MTYYYDEDDDEVVIDEQETVDSLMEEFVKETDDYTNPDISDSIWTCVDNYIDDLCLEQMSIESSIFESDGNSNVPFCYILDKVMEKVNGDIIKQSYEDTQQSYEASSIDYESQNTEDPDYCEGIDFSDITPDDFQIYIKNPNLDREEECELDTDIDYDSVYNA